MFALHLNEPMGVWIDITITKKTNTTEKSMDVFQNKYWHKKTDWFLFLSLLNFFLPDMFV